MNNINKLLGNIGENARMALVALMSNKLRALLTTFGIGIGIAAVIVLVSLGNAVQDYVTKQFMGVGYDLIYVRSAPTAGGFGERAGRSGRRATILGTVANYFDILNKQLASGRFFDDTDVQSSARVAVIGQTTIKNLFGANIDPIGENIRVNDVPFKVIGTLASSGTNSGGGDQDDVIVVPISAAQAHLNTEKTSAGELPITQIYIQAANVDSIDSIISNVTILLRAQHKVKAGADDDFNLNAQKDLLDSFQQTITMLTLFLSVVGGISLLVGGIGVMNIMLVTVAERTREFRHSRRR